MFAFGQTGSGKTHTITGPVSQVYVLILHGALSQLFLCKEMLVYVDESQYQCEVESYGNIDYSYLRNKKKDIFYV